MNTQSARKKITFALFVATFLAAIEGTIVGTAMPSITSGLQGVQQYSWVISIYLLATVITTPVYGKLSDLYGRKNMFIIGALIFLTGSMLSGLAQSMNQLILFRALQGLGAGALTTIPYTIIGDLYPFEQRAKVQGWMSSIWGIAGISGPLVGGLLVDYVSWRAIFYMNLPFGIAAIFLLAASMKEKFEKRKRHIDYPGIITFTIGMFSLLYAISLLGEEEIGATTGLIIIILIAIAVLFLLWFARIEQRSPEPIIPFQLFKNKIILFANLDSFLLCVINVVVIFYLPLWIQGVYGMPASLSGLAMIPLSIAWPLGSILAGNFIAKLGLRAICLIGACFLAAGSIGLAMLHSESSIFQINVCMFLCGLSFGLTLTATTVAVTSAVGWDMRGAAVASNNFIRTLGQTIGITLFGLLLHTGSANLIEPVVLEASLHKIFLWVAVLTVAIIILALVMPKLQHADSSEAEAVH